jgi:hypothetical protein
MCGMCSSKTYGQPQVEQRLSDAIKLAAVRAGRENKARDKQKVRV